MDTETLEQHFAGLGADISRVGKEVAENTKLLTSHALNLTWIKTWLGALSAAFAAMLVAMAMSGRPAIVSETPSSPALARVLGVESALLLQLLAEGVEGFVVFNEEVEQGLRYSQVVVLHNGASSRTFRIGGYRSTEEVTNHVDTAIEKAGVTAVALLDVKRWQEEALGLDDVPSGLGSTGLFGSYVIKTGNPGAVAARLSAELLIANLPILQEEPPMPVDTAVTMQELPELLLTWEREFMEWFVLQARS